MHGPIGKCPCFCGDRRGVKPFRAISFTFTRACWKGPRTWLKNWVEAHVSTNNSVAFLRTNPNLDQIWKVTIPPIPQQVIGNQRIRRQKERAKKSKCFKAGKSESPALKVGERRLVAQNEEIWRGFVNNIHTRTTCVTCAIDFQSMTMMTDDSVIGGARGRIGKISMKYFNLYI